MEYFLILIQVILFWNLGAVFVAWLATTFNRSFANYFLLGFFLSPPISLITLLFKGKHAKTCPKCAEGVKHEAIICKFCGHDFSAKTAQIIQSTQKQKATYEQFLEAKEKLDKNEITKEEYDKISKAYLEN